MSFAHRAHARSASTTIAATSALLLLGAGLVAMAPQQAHALAKGRPDLNGDGRADLVMASHGAVAITYGAGNSEIVRLSKAATDRKLWFGNDVATGDFNKDGYDDLAVSGPNYASGKGGVWVYRGRKQGILDASGKASRIRLMQGTNGLAGVAEEKEYFGGALVAADFNGDGYADLAVSTPEETFSGARRAGIVQVIPGSSKGLVRTKARTFSQNTQGVANTAETDDHFGGALAAGDITGDGLPDLVVGASGEGVGRNRDRYGMVHVLRGTTSGVTGTGSTHADSKALGLQLTYTNQEKYTTNFGVSLAVGNITGDRYGDLVVGAPSATVSGKGACGALAVFRGNAAGISAQRRQVVSQNARAVAETCQDSDLWGWSVAVGDLTGDGRAEVLAAAPFEGFSGKQYAGAYTVLRPTATGVTGTGSFVVTQNTANVPSSAQDEEYFGAGLAVLDLNGDGRMDVLAGAPGEARKGTQTGAVFQILSSPTGRPAKGSAYRLGTAYRDGKGAIFGLGETILGTPVLGGRVVGGGPVVNAPVVTAAVPEAAAPSASSTAGAESGSTETPSLTVVDEPAPSQSPEVTVEP